MTIIFLGITEIFKKYKIFILTTAMLSISLIVSVYAFIVYDTYHYPIKSANKVFGKNVENVYSLKFSFFSMNTENSRLEDIYNMFKEIEALAGVYSCGAYCYINDNNVHELLITPSLLDYMGIKDSNAEKLDFDIQEGDEKTGRAYIGEKLLDKYPIGSKYVEEQTGNMFVITGIIETNHKWMPDSIYDTNIVSLDDVIILDLDYICTTENGVAILNNALDNILIISDNNDVEACVGNIISFYNFDISGIFKLEDLLHNYERDLMDNAGENYIFPFVILACTIMVSIVCTKINLLNNKKDYGILLSNGFSKLELCGIVVVEKLSSLIISEIICFVYWIIKRSAMIDFLGVLYRDSIIFQVIIAVIILLLMVECPVRHILKTHACELIRKVV